MMPPSQEPIATPGTVLSSSGQSLPKQREGCVKFDHITFWASNAKQAASYYISHFGFSCIGYQGLETGSREFAKHAVKNGDVIFLFVSSLSADNEEFYNHIKLHGDFVKDIAFTVDDLDSVLETSLNNGAKLQKSWEEEDENGSVRIATIQTTGDVTHTFVERTKFFGPFLPKFKNPVLRQPVEYPSLNCFSFIDHCVATRYEDTIESTQDFYEKSLSFHRFWSVDDGNARSDSNEIGNSFYRSNFLRNKIVNVETDQSSLKFLVVANSNESIKMTILEPGPVKPGKKKSQVQEFNEFNAGPGIQHIALHTSDIISAVRTLRRRGVDFLSVPDNYYETLKERLKDSYVVIRESLQDLQEQQILLDYDDNGYLLQIFTKPVQDRPTLFLEIIQRNNHNGFGAGNFTALFKAVEREQQLRGNLK